MWDHPQVHVLFNGYTLSFTIKDINKALSLLAETGDSTYGTSCGLDSATDFVCEIINASGMEYTSRLQQMLHREVVSYLLLSRRGHIQDRRHKHIKEIIADKQVLQAGDLDILYIKFYDPRNNKLLFFGSMRTDMYYKDMGLD
ncbi:MAG: hypothetical protein V4649_04360 [Bacteroidota bacterium]